MTTTLTKQTAGALLMLVSTLAMAAEGSDGAHPFKTDHQHQTLARPLAHPAPIKPAPTAKATQGQPAQAMPAGQTPPATPALTQPPSGALVLHKDSLLSQDIDAWAKTQGLRLLWNSKKDYLIYSAIVLNGLDRDDVLSRLGQLFQSENYGLVIKLYSGNNVLIIDGQ